MNKRKMRLTFAAVTMLLAVFAPREVIAQSTVTWDGGGADDNWTTGLNWGGSAPAAGDTLVFSGTTRQSNTNDFAASTTFESITLSQGGFTLSGNAVLLSAAGAKVTSTGDNTIALNLTPSSGAMSIESQSDALTVSGSIGGTGGFTKTGAGTLLLAGSNAYSGLTTLNGGVLRLGSANAIRLNNETALAFTSGSLDLNGYDATLNNFTLGAGSQILLGGASLAIGLTDANRTFNGVISGTGSVTKAGANLLTLSAQQVYAGDTILMGGNIRNNIVNGLPVSTVLRFGAIDTSRRFQPQGFDQTLAGVDSTAATGGNLILEAASDGVSNKPATLTLNVATNESYTFSGYVRNAAGGATNSKLTLVKNGAGTQVFSTNTVTYSGATTINDGILEFAGGGGGAGATANNSEFNLNGGSVRFSGAPLSGAVPLRTTAITGAGAVRIANIIRIGGTGHTFLGDVIIENGGRLRLDVNDTLPPTSVLRFGEDDTARRLQMQGRSQTLAGVDSTAAAGGILIVEAAEDNLSDFPATLTLNVPAGQTYTFNGYVRNAAGSATNSALSIVKSGDGTQVFSGVPGFVAYSGSTTVNGGVLVFSGNGSVADNSAITLDGGSVKFSGGGTRTQAIGGTAGSVIKTGENTLTLSGTNAYTGSTVVEAGLLRLGTAESVAGSVGFTMNGGVLDLNGFAVTNAVLDSSVAGPGGVVSNGTLAVTAAVSPGGSNTVGSVTLPDAPDLSGTLWIDVSPNSDSCDQLNVRGSLSVSKLDLRVVDVNLLNMNYSYTIAQCAGGTATGPFLSDNLPSAWEVSCQAARIVIRYRRGTLISVL